jgi:hypothetical protein
MEKQQDEVQGSAAGKGRRRLATGCSRSAAYVCYQRVGAQKNWEQTREVQGCSRRQSRAGKHDVMQQCEAYVLCLRVCGRAAKHTNSHGRQESPGVIHAMHCACQP